MSTADFAGSCNTEIGIMRPAAATMRAILDQPQMQIAPGVGDGMGARLVAEAGFKVGLASSSSISAMKLAMPDMDLLSFTEMRDAVANIVEAAPSVLWLGDGDSGYGNEIAVQKTVREYARLGCAAVMIEDKQWPRPLGKAGAKVAVERDAAVLRMKAAVQAAREEGVLLLARTDAVPSHGFKEALDRIKLFVELGADILFLYAPGTEEEQRAAIQASAGRPHVAVSHPTGKNYTDNNTVLSTNGVKLAIYSQEVLSSAVRAIRLALSALAGGGEPVGLSAAVDLATAIRASDYLSLDHALTCYS